MENITHLYGVKIPETNDSEPNIEFLISEFGKLTMKATKDPSWWGGKNGGFVTYLDGISYEGNISSPKKLKSYVDVAYKKMLNRLKKDLENIQKSIDIIESNMNK